MTTIDNARLRTNSPIGSAVIFTLVFFAGTLLPPAANAEDAEATAPRLAVQITVDQLRGDLPTRYRDRLGEGGLKWLLEHGVHFANARFTHANTETIVGHACPATGAQPRVQGPVANVWLDRSLGRLLKALEAKVGLENTVIVLSADHGSPEAPGALTELGLKAEYVDPEGWDRAPAIAALEQRFGVGEELIDQYFHPYLYLNRELMAAKGLDQAEVERAVAEVLTDFDGVALAVSSSALRTGNLPDTPILRSVLNNFNPKRSGDIYVVFEPHRFINDFDGLIVACTHGSPWSYDTFVPIFVVAPGVPPQTVHRRVSPLDIAPTLAALVGAKPPSGADGSPLLEVTAPTSSLAQDTTP